MVLALGAQEERLKGSEQSLAHSKPFVFVGEEAADCVFK